MIQTNRARIAVAVFAGLLFQPVSQAQIVTIVAGGNPSATGDGGLATNASLTEPTAVAFDSLGNLYIADYMDNRIRKVDTKGIITTVAGNGTADSTGDGGPAVSAAIHLPWGVAVDGQGNVYFTERINNRVRRVDPSGIITTVAGTGIAGFSGDGGPATKAQIYNPFGLATDNAGNLYIADSVNKRIRMVSPDGIIHTVAGNGSPNSSGDGQLATAAAISTPTAVAVDNAGNIFIAAANSIRKVNTAGIISTVAGSGGAGATGDGGPATSATMQAPQGVIVDSAGQIFIGDTSNNRVREVNNAGIITSIAGAQSGPVINGGRAANTSIGAEGLAIDCQENLYVADSAHNLVLKISGLAAPAGPAICQVLNGASLQPGISPNSWATIKGFGLAGATDTWDKAVVNGQLPVGVDGVSVTVGGKPAYIYYVSSSQINFLVPDVPAGPQQVIVTNGALTSPPSIVPVSQYSPAFFAWPGNQAVATRQDFTWAVKNTTFSGTTTIAAKPGEIIIFWGTGFGPTTPAAPFGVQVPADQIYSTSSMPAVTVGNISAPVYGAALAPGDAGLYQVAIQVPGSISDGDWPVQTTVGGLQSPAGVILSIHH
jgi:uncharacterized protein (TIGR03437 family)